MVLVGCAIPHYCPQLQLTQFSSRPGAVRLLSSVNHLPSLAMPANDVLIQAIFLPPLAVLLRRGCGASFLINIILTILGWIPGVIHAWIVIIAEPSRHSSSRRPSHSYSNHHSSSHAGRHHHHHHHHSSGGGGGHHHSHTGRHHARPARRSYDRPAYRDGYDVAPAPSRYGGGAPPPGYGPPPQMGYAPPRRY